MKTRSLTRHAAILALAAVLPGAALAQSTVGGALGALAAAALIRSQAETIDKLLDAGTLRWGGRTRDPTRVVPIFSVGRKTYVGAAQIAGDPGALNRVRAVFEVTGQVEGGKGRFGHLIPSSSSNPLRLDRVHGVALVAVIDASVWGNAGTFPMGGKKDAAVLRAAAAVAASRVVGDDLNRFLNRISGHPPRGTTRVVPVLTVGEKSYVGLAQVIGPSAMQVDAVLQVEEVLGGKFRARVMVPVDAGLGLNRIPDVGVGTLLDMTLATATVSASDRKEDPAPPPPPVQDTSSHPVSGPDPHDHGHHAPRPRSHPGRGRGPPPWAKAHGRRAQDACEDILEADSGCAGWDEKCWKRFEKWQEKECEKRMKHGGHPGKGRGKGKGRWK